MNLLRKVNWADVVIRATKTAVATFVALQGFLPILSWAGGDSPVDFSSSRAALVSGIVAGVTYIWNVLIQALSADPTPGSRAHLERVSSRLSGVGQAPAITTRPQRRAVADPEPPPAA